MEETKGLENGVYQYIDSKCILNNIRNMNYDKKIELFDDYISLFSFDELKKMLSYVEKDKQEEFLDKYIDNYHSLLSDIWYENTKFGRFEGLNGDTLLNKYIDLLDYSKICEIMTILIDTYNDSISVMMYLLLKTTNSTTIKNISDAGKVFGVFSDIKPNEKHR